MGMRHVDNHAEFIGAPDELASERGQTTPFLSTLIGRAVGKLIIAGMHQPDHTHTGGIKFIKHINIRAERIGIFNAFINNALARSGDARGIIGSGGGGKIIAQSLDHLVNDQIALACMRQRFGVSGFGQRPLGGINHPKAAIQAALFHARQIHLCIVGLPIMAAANIKSGAVEH